MVCIKKKERYDKWMPVVFQRVHTSCPLAFVPLRVELGAEYGLVKDLVGFSCGKFR